MKLGTSKVWLVIYVAQDLGCVGYWAVEGSDLTPVYFYSKVYGRVVLDKIRHRSQLSIEDCKTALGLLEKTNLPENPCDDDGKAAQVNRDFMEMDYGEAEHQRVERLLCKVRPLAMDILKSQELN